jgi:hypothetical protein
VKLPYGEEMLKFYRLLILVGFVAILVCSSLAAGSHHHHHRRHRSHQHRWVTRGQKNDIVVTGERSSLTEPLTLYSQTRSGRWWTTSVDGKRHVETASPSIARKVNDNLGPSLSDFGYGKVAAADLVRFAQPSPVVDNVVATLHGIRGGKKPGWDSSDETKEGEFIANTQSMLLKSFSDDHASAGN